MENRVATYAKKSCLGMLNPAHSVKKVFPNSIDFITETNGHYIGIKEAEGISPSFVASLAALGYYHHTIDKASHAGRGIDIDLKNPITGRYMTGSSSGTALNVFLGINDVGVGTDGGGSVLGPAISLNLYSVIHPELGKCGQEMAKEKYSTDGLRFTPSIGFMARELEPIEDLLGYLFTRVSEPQESFAICLDEKLIDLKATLDKISNIISLNPFTDKYSGERQALINQLNQLLEKNDVIISEEGPVDVAGIGDTIFGHFDKQTKAQQIAACKGFIRVVNMAKAIAITVPTGELGKGYVLICKNTETGLGQILAVAKLLQTTQDELITPYFGNLNHYFLHGV